MEERQRMSGNSAYCKIVGISRVVVLFAAAVFITADAAAQAPSDALYGKNEAVAADALNCWWKSDKSSIRIGEEFTVALTCRSAETGRERTVLNESLLDPNVLALPPYQVKNGRRYKDIIRILPGPDGPVTLRSVQYAYTAKLMGEGFFGRDVPLPPLEIHYHIDLVTNKDTVAPGKERTYVLPPLPMRIQSLVPKAANAIRDAGNETFGDIEGRRKNAVIAFIIAGVFLLLPLFVLLPVLVRAVRGRRERGPNGTIFRTRDLLKRLEWELGRIERRCRTASWDDVSIETVLSIFRVSASLAVARRIVQTPAAAGTRGLEGQLAFRKGLWPRMKVLVSASLTPEEMTRELSGANWQGSDESPRKALLDETQRAFAVMNDARYATQANAADRALFDGALKTGLRLLRELRRDRCMAFRMKRAVHSWLMRFGRQWKRS